LKKSGSWRYSLDPTTEVLCLGFRLPHWKKGRTELWHPEFKHLGMKASWDGVDELWDWILDGGLVEAHNAWFERGLWTNLMTPRYGWLAISPVQWRCSAAKAAAHALPRGLDDACAALHLPVRKDAAGGKVMMKLNKPRKPRKAEREAAAKRGQPEPSTKLLWHESRELFDHLFDYCRQDVLAEEALSEALPDISEDEQALYDLDQRINERGFRLDSGAVRTALSLIASETDRLNGELSVLTNGTVKRATQRAQLVKWLATEGLDLPNTQAETIDAYLHPDSREHLTPAARQALEILRALGRSSTAKYESMRNWICPDERVHGSLLYHGASTGRWTGAGIQPHNFVKGTVKGHSMDDVWAYLSSL
jgi:DNA polymerase